MLRVLPDIPPAELGRPLVPAALVQGFAQRATQLADAQEAARAIVAEAEVKAAQMRDEASRSGFFDGCVHALRLLVPSLVEMLAERGRWLESVRYQLRQELRGLLQSPDFSQAQIESWTRLQVAGGASRITIHLPKSIEDLAGPLSAAIDDRVEVRVADIAAPVVEADDLVFTLQPESAVQVDEATEALLAQIDSFVEHQARAYATIVTTPDAANQLQGPTQEENP